MQLFLDEVAARYLAENIVIVMDGAGWHHGEQLKPADNVRLLLLLLYSPELNLVEHIWDDLREKYFHNRAFDSLDALKDHLVVALQAFETDHARTKSITAWPWIINAISDAN